MARKAKAGGGKHRAGDEDTEQRNARLRGEALGRADALRNNRDAAEYKDVVLGLPESRKLTLD